MTTLAGAPWNLILDEEIHAYVIASNNYGDSPASPSGNGGIMRLVPDSPVNLLNDALVTSDQQIIFSWEAGEKDGGKPILDYRVYYDQGEDIAVFTLL